MRFIKFALLLLLPALAPTTAAAADAVAAQQGNVLNAETVNALAVESTEVKPVVLLPPQASTASAATTIGSPTTSTAATATATRAIKAAVTPTTTTLVANSLLTKDVAKTTTTLIKSKTGKRDSNEQSAAYASAKDEQPFRPIIFRRPIQQQQQPQQQQPQQQQQEPTPQYRQLYYNTYQRAPSAPPSYSVDDVRQIYYDKSPQASAAAASASQSQQPTNGQELESASDDYAQSDKQNDANDIIYGHAQPQQQKQLNYAVAPAPPLLYRMLYAPIQHQQPPPPPPLYTYAEPPALHYAPEAAPAPAPGQLLLTPTQPVVPQHMVPQRIQYIVAIPLSYARQLQTELESTHAPSPAPSSSPSPSPSPSPPSSPSPSPSPSPSASPAPSPSPSPSALPLSRPHHHHQHYAETAQTQTRAHFLPPPPPLAGGDGGAPQSYITQYIQLPLSALLAATQAAKAQYQPPTQPGLHPRPYYTNQLEDTSSEQKHQQYQQTDLYDGQQQQQQQQHYPHQQPQYYHQQQPAAVRIGVGRLTSGKIVYAPTSAAPAPAPSSSSTSSSPSATPSQTPQRAYYEAAAPRSYSPAPPIVHHYNPIYVQAPPYEQQQKLQQQQQQPHLHGFHFGGALPIIRFTPPPPRAVLTGVPTLQFAPAPPPAQHQYALLPQQQPLRLHYVAQQQHQQRLQQQQQQHQLQQQQHQHQHQHHQASLAAGIGGTVAVPASVPYFSQLNAVQYGTHLFAPPTTPTPPGAAAAPAHAPAKSAPQQQQQQHYHARSTSTATSAGGSNSAAAAAGAGAGRGANVVKYP